MKRTIKIQFGRSVKNIFERTFETEDTDNVIKVMKEYETFFNNYWKSHTITNRRWTFPIIYFKDNEEEFIPKYKVCPNGSWEEITEKSVVI